jgi:hypothetical protein
MATVKEAVVLLVLEGRGEIEEVEGAGKAFNGIVEVSCCLGVFADHQVVELAGTIVLKDGADQEGWGAAPEIFADDPLRGGR